jgi:hydrogenase maturation protease
MKLDRIKDIANAVLYEGYILYPYRPSSIKNRQRWTFGCVFPQDFAGRQCDASIMQTQVLLRGSLGTRLDTHIRFLQVLTREVGVLPHPIDEFTPGIEGNAKRVQHLEVDGRQYLAWDEAVEREVVLPDCSVADMIAATRQTAFQFPSAQAVEPLADAKAAIRALLIRCSCAIKGLVETSVERLSEDIYQLTVRIKNVSTLAPTDCEQRHLAQRYAFASTHTILGIRDGAFISLMDPPEDLRDVAANCDNQGTWPVLVGKSGDTDAVLSSPIILYDHPDIAQQSPGDLFDATEIDEILTLRILTMTDAEKREMAAADMRARALLERTHGLTAAELVQMHGVMHAPGAAGAVCRPEDSPAGHTAADGKPRLASLLHDGRTLAIGTAVRLRPKVGGDIMDLALAGEVAIIEAIERDFEDRVHIAVTLRDDPGRDLGVAGFPGHRFYFSQEEIEPLGVGEMT